MSDTPILIAYKGESRELKIGNAAMMRFSRLGGSFEKLESDPVEQAITLACAALGLTGDPIDHADDFPPLAQLADPIKQAMERYSGDSALPGESAGGAAVPSVESATD